MYEESIGAVVIGTTVIGVLTELNIYISRPKSQKRYYSVIYTKKRLTDPLETWLIPN